MNTHEKSYKGLKWLAIYGLVGSLAACGGGGGSAPSTGESIVARGVITQMGSIWVNGVEYETPDGGSYSNDDSTSSTANYEVGQVVSIRGTRNDDGVSGTADEVEYEAELEGAAVGNTINGVTIITDQTLTTGIRYEVSGFWVNDSTIEATFIKEDDDGGAPGVGDSVDEVKGFVESFTAGSLTLHGVTYTYSGTPVVAVGDYVEIHFSGTNASLVELEDDVFDNLPEGQEIEFEGSVNLNTAGCAADADFRIDSTCIDWDSVTEWSDGLTGSIDMVNGLRVEAEGHFVGDLLVAEKIKGRGNEVRITSTAGNISGVDGTFDLLNGDIQVTTESGLTEFDLDTGSTVGDITSGDGLEVRGIRTGATTFLALRVKSEGVNADRHELRAKIDENGADSSLNTVTVMGITSEADLNTELKIEDTIIATGSGTTTESQIDSFLDGIDDDNIISLTNGPRDVVEVRIDTTAGDGSMADPYTARQIEIEIDDD